MSLLSAQAFTLIELLVVVLIIGILAAIAIPQYEKSVEKARALQAISMVKAIADAQEVYFMSNGTYAETLSDLGIDIPGDDCVTNDRNRKCVGFFEFDVASTAFQNVIASSGRRQRIIKEKVSNAHYALFKIKGDPTLYCKVWNSSSLGKALCRSLSGNISTTLQGYKVYIVQ